MWGAHVFSRGVVLPILFVALAHAGCAPSGPVETADVILLHGNVYTLSWSEPGLDGAPAADAPRSASGWTADAEAVAVADGKILFVGADRDAEAYKGETTRVIDVQGATVVPGLIESHVHIANLGEGSSRIDLRGIDTVEEIVERVRASAIGVAPGRWIEGYGWDEGAWAARYPDLELLSQKVPEHPVYLKGLHGFAVWGNRLAFEQAGITADTEPPAGGEILRDSNGDPTGILLNRAVTLLESAIPAPTVEQVKAFILAGLEALAAGGYVAVHEAGADRVTMQAFESLEAEGRLPLRVYAMLEGREPDLMDDWLQRGPDEDIDSMLVTRCVKAFYDGALGSRGALLLEDYSDMPGHRGVSDRDYGFDGERLAASMKRGFQTAIHAIGDAGNRETLDFLESVIREYPEAKKARHRIEHAQVVHPDDIPRFGALDVIASMEPPHCAEDKAWAEDRLGSERCAYAYAWRSLRRAGARLAFNSDLPGSDYDIFYGLHSAITRRDENLEPEGGWYPEQRMTPEEALTGYTIWGAYSAFMEGETGTLEPGKWADITVMDIDPLVVGETDPAKLLEGKILLTMVNGEIVHDAVNR